MRPWQDKALMEAALGGASPEEIAAMRATFTRAAVASAPRRRDGDPRVRILTPEEAGALRKTGTMAPSAGDGSSGGSNSGSESDEGASGGDDPPADSTQLAREDVPSVPTLLRALRRLAREQEEDNEIALDMGKQGDKKPTSYDLFREWIVGMDEPMVLCVMGDGAIVTPLHSIFKYSAPGRSRDQYDGCYLGAVGDRQGHADPPFVKIKKSHFEWREIKPPKEGQANGSVISGFFAIEANRMKFFDASSGERETEGFWVPKFPMVPASIAYKMTRRPMTAWDLFEEVHKYLEGRDRKVAKLLLPVAQWTLMAACRGTTGDQSAMAYVLPPITMPSKALQKRMKQRLDATLGKRVTARVPQGGQGQPHLGLASPQAAAQSAAASMARDQPTATGLSDVYTRGISDAMRMYHDMNSETVYKRFSTEQKGAIMGFCAVTSWKDVPPLWKKIEGSKAEGDLRRILDKEWGQYEDDLDVQFYSQFWTDEFLKAIRTVEFTESDEASFVTSETGISALCLLPKSTKEVAKLKRDKLAMIAAKGNISVADAKKLQRRPRMPPAEWEPMVTLLTTYSMLLRMLFGRRNNHLKGVDQVRRVLMKLGKNKSKLNAQYFANVMWAVLDDGCKHFSECTSLEDLQMGAAYTITWPTTDLFGFADTMRGSQQIELLTLPDEWREVIDDERKPPAFRGDPGGARGGRGGGGGGAKGRGDGGRRRSPQKKRDEGEQRSFKEDHPERYGSKGGVNPDVPPAMKKLLGPLLKAGPLNFKRLCSAAKVGFMKMAKWRGYKGGQRHPMICPAYACGECTWGSCECAHLQGGELPAGWVAHLHDELQPGVVALLKKATDGPPSKRARKEESDGDDADTGGKSE